MPTEKGEEPTLLELYKGAADSLDKHYGYEQLLIEKLRVEQYLVDVDNISIKRTGDIIDDQALESIYLFFKSSSNYHLSESILALIILDEEGGYYFETGVLPEVAPEVYGENANSLMDVIPEGHKVKVEKLKY